MKWNSKITNFLTGSAIGLLGYSMMTRYELGLFKVLPMKGHLTMDAISGASLAAAPFVFLKGQERTGTIIGVLAGLGAYEIAAALMTQTQPSLGSGNFNVGDDIVVDEVDIVEIV
jgi:hypothetical protein